MGARKSEGDWDFDAEVGRRIAATRKRRGMSVSQLGMRTGIHAKTLYRYEAGGSACSAAAAVKIAHVLSVPLATLVPTLEKNSHAAEI